MKVKGYGMEMGTHQEKDPLGHVRDASETLLRNYLQPRHFLQLASSSDACYAVKTTKHNLFGREKAPNPGQHLRRCQVS